MPLERAAECRFGFVSNTVGHDGQAQARLVAQQVRRQLHAPLGEIAHRSNAQGLHEPLGQDRARYRHALRQP